MSNGKDDGKEISVLNKLYLNGNGKKKYAVIGAVAVLLVVILAAVLMRPKYMTIAPSEYVKVSTKGLDGSGTAKFTLDAARLQRAIAQEQDLKPAQESELESLLVQAEQYFTLSKDTELENGDSIAIQCRMPSDYLDDYHVKIENSDYHYTVSGLIGVQNVALEDYFTFTFSGYEKHGYASYSLDTGRLYDDIAKLIREVDDSAEAETYIEKQLYGDLFYQDVLQMELDRTEELSNDDKLTFTCQISDTDTGLETYGIILEDVSCEQEVEGLDTLETIDLAPYIAISFAGYDGDGSAAFSLNKEALAEDLKKRFPDGRGGYDAENMDNLADVVENYVNRYMDRSIEPSENLSTGDEVHVQVKGKEEENYVSEAGFVLENADTTVAAEGLTAVDTWKLGDYLNVEFSGYDERGEAEGFLDLEKLSEDLQKQYAQGRGDYSTESVDRMIRNEISWNFTVAVDKTSELRNGDQIEVSVLADSQEETEETEETGAAETSEELPTIYIRELGIVLESAQQSVTVEGLEAQREVDLMELIQVEFSGITPNVQVAVTVDQENPLEDYLDYDSIREIPGQIVAYNGDSLDITLEYDAEAALRDGYKIINSTQSYEIAGLDTYDFGLESVSDPKLEQLIAEREEQNLDLLQKEESGMLELFETERVQILWNRVKLGLERVVKLYAPEDSYNPNRMILVYRASVPLMLPDESISGREIYIINIMENVSESEAGISWTNERIGYFYDSRESVDEALKTFKTDLWGDETSVDQTEAVNELVEEELADEEVGAEQESSADEEIDTKEEAVQSVSAVAVPEIPEISSQAQAHAAASLELEGHRYYLFDEAVTWQEAKALCEKEGGTLATVTSWPEQAVLQTLIQQGEHNHYWIGATDEEMEGSWTWVTGEAFSYRGWDSGQPDNAGTTEHYAVISRSFGNSWNDYPNEQEEVGYILEVSAAQPDAEGEKNSYLVDSVTLRHENHTAYDAFGEDTYGNGHYGALYFDASNSAWAQYELSGTYASLTGELSVYSEAESGASFDLAIFGDGKLLWSKCGMTRQMNPASFTVDVRDVQRLTIETRNLGDQNNGWLILDQAKLHYKEISGEETKEETEEDIEEQPSLIVDRLAEQYEMMNRGMEQNTMLCRDTAGVLHDSFLEFYADEGAEAAWNLDGNYDTFLGTLTTFRRTGANVSMTVRIYGDDRLLFEAKDIDRTTGPLTFEADVKNVKVLRMEAEQTGDAYDAYVYLVDDALTRIDDASEDPAKEAASASVLPEIPANVSVLSSVMAEYETCVYYLIETPTTWKNASRFCEQMGGHLAVPDSPLAVARLRSLMKNGAGDGYWIGASDEAAEGEWQWVTGEPVTYTNWADNQPDNYNSENGGENYLEMYRNGTWNDAGEDALLGFVIQFSAENSGSEEELARLANTEPSWNGGGYEYFWEACDTHGEPHLSGYSLNTSSEGWITCDLNGAYEKISGTIVPAENADQNAKMNLAVFGDGVLLYAANEIEGWSQSVPFEADVTGVNTLTIRTSNEGDAGWMLLNDVALTKAEESSMTGRKAAFADLQLVDSAGAEFTEGLFRDSYGNNYDGNFCFRASDGGYAVWLLDGAYTEATGVLAASASTGTDSSMSVKIYADDELVFEQEKITRMSQPVSFAVDVTGVKNLKIVTEDTAETYEGTVYLAGDALY